MRLRKGATAGLLAAGWVVLFAGSASAFDLNCADFPSQAEAQAVYDANPSDPNNLDEDDDGQACEDHPYGTTGTTGTTGQVATPPAGGVATGDGSTADSDTAVLPFVVGGLGLAAAGSAAVAARRTARGGA
jgi:Excalibur calcium-binding domain